MDRYIGVSRPGKYKFEELFRTSWALLIGVNTYKDPIPNLRFAEADATALAELLPEIGVPAENIRTLLGPAVSREAINHLIDEMSKGMDKDDRLIFHFAGHGVPVEGGGGRKSGFILLPQSEINGTWPTSQSPYLPKPPSEAIGMGPLFVTLDELPPKHKLILLDTCFSGFLKTRAIQPDTHTADARLHLWKDPVTQILTAGRDDQQAVEDPSLGHGLFSHAVLQGLRGNAARHADQLITFDTLADFVRDKVARESEGRQDPQPCTKSGDGTFFFFHGAEQAEANKLREQAGTAEAQHAHNATPAPLEQDQRPQPESVHFPRSKQQALDLVAQSLDPHVRAHLETIIPTNCISIPLMKRAEFFYEAHITDARCLDRSKWVFDISFSIGEVAVLQKSPTLLKVCSARFLPIIVKRDMPGVELTHLGVPPAAISTHVDMQYFSINKAGPGWDDIVETKQLGIYVPADLANPELELLVVLDS